MASWLASFRSMRGRSMRGTQGEGVESTPSTLRVYSISLHISSV